MPPDTAVNQHDAETRQFLALVAANRPGLAFALGVIRSPVTMKVATIAGAIIAMAVAVAVGVPQQLAEIVMSKIG